MQNVNRRDFLRKSAASATTLSLSKQQYSLSTMPRVDIHAHFGNCKQIDGIILNEEESSKLFFWLIDDLMEGYMQEYNPL